jgi:hypothetical protein
MAPRRDGSPDSTFHLTGELIAKLQDSTRLVRARIELSLRALADSRRVLADVHAVPMHHDRTATGERSFAIAAPDIRDVEPAS